MMRMNILKYVSGPAIDYHSLSGLHRRNYQQIFISLFFVIAKIAITNNNTNKSVYKISIYTIVFSFC